MIKRVLLAGGGTAGHVNPMLATGTQLASRGVKVAVLGTSEGLEAELVPAAGLELLPVAKVPFPRRPSLSALKFPFRFWAAVKQAEDAIKKIDAQVVVGFGGYVSTPAYLAARRMGVRVAIHEQNARPGLANKLGARWADLVGLTFSGTPLECRNGKTVVTGLPLRPQIAGLIAQKAAPGWAARRGEICESFGFCATDPILLVTGGSLGALRLNQAMVEAKESLGETVQVLHLTGKGKATEVRAMVGDNPRWVVLEYLHQMEQALAIADLVLCRSGASTVAELSALGLPAVYVPLAIGNGEQRLNAAEVTKAGGALMIADKEFTAKQVISQVLPLLSDSERLTQMSRIAVKYGHGNAAQEFSDLIEGIEK